jgi:hypothetical protein
LVLDKRKGVDLGGSGHRDGFTLEVVGCECRTLDFELAFVKFANEWVAAANSRKSESHQLDRSVTKPCGCKGNA